MLKLLTISNDNNEKIENASSNGIGRRARLLLTKYPSGLTIYSTNANIKLTVDEVGLAESVDVPSCQLGGPSGPCGFEDSFESPTADVKDISDKGCSLPICLNNTDKPLVCGGGVC